MATKSSRSRARVNDRAPTQPYLQTVANAAARTALHEFANSPERKDELQKIMQAAIDGTLEKFGMDATDRTAVEKFRADMVHLRTWREFMELIKRDGVGAATSWLVKGFMIVVSLGLLTLFGKHLSGN